MGIDCIQKWLHGYCMITAWWLHGYCMVTAWEVHEDCMGMIAFRRGCITTTSLATYDLLSTIFGWECLIVHERLHDGVFANAAWLQVPFGFSSACDLLSKNLLQQLNYIRNNIRNMADCIFATASLLQLFLGSMTAT